MRIPSILTAMVLAWGLFATVAAQGKSKAQREDKQPPPSGAIRFTNQEKLAIQAGYQTMPITERPPGFPKGGKLHPELENKLTRGGKLPAGWVQKIVPFPPSIDRRMPLDPPYVKRGYVEGLAVIVDTRTDTVLDFMVPRGAL
jgi:hypothetical protein